jgi:hypothetical protein
VIAWQIQIAQLLRRMELSELANRSARNVLELSIFASMMKLLGVLAGKRPYHVA